MTWHKIGEIYKRSNSIKVKHPSESCLCIWMYLYPKHFWSCLIACLPAMLVCDSTFVGRAAPGLTPIQSNPIPSVQILKFQPAAHFLFVPLLPRACKSTIVVWLLNFSPCWPNPKLDLYDSGLVPRSDNQLRSHLGMKVLASPSLILGITTLICGYACYIWWQLWPLISPSTNLSCSG